MKRTSLCYKRFPGILMIAFFLTVCITCITAQDEQKKVVLITGSAGGIGRATAELLIEKGHIVYGGDILYEENSYLAAIGGNALRMDITSDNEVESGVQQIIREQGRIDVLFANAGYNLHGPIECLDISDARNQFEVNLFGHARCAKAVLPYMREQGGGIIIINTSLGGKISAPGISWYAASKHALEAFADGLRMEVRKFNISVSVIEPGAVRTGIQKNAAGLEKAKKSPEAPNYDLKTYEEKFKSRFSIGADPAVIAKSVLRIINSKYPERRYMPTPDAVIAYRLHSLFGYGLSDDLLLNMFFGTNQPNPFKRRSITISADAWALLNKGYSTALNYNTGRLSLGISYLDVIQQDLSDGAIKLEQKRQGFGAGLGAFISDEQRGFNFGLEFVCYTRVAVTELETGEELEKDLYRAGFYTGYLWQPFKSLGFYIEPSIHVGYAFGDRDLYFPGGTRLSKEGFDIGWPVINIGWKINF